MTATTVNLGNLNPKRVPFGLYMIPLDLSIATTLIDEENDRANLAAVENGHRIEWLFLKHGDGDVHATPTLDLDLILVTGADDPSDAGTETTILNAGTEFQSADTTGKWYQIGVTVNNATGGRGWIRSKVVTGAATAQALTLDGFFLVSGQ